MRIEFARVLYNNMKNNKNIFLIVGDVGYGLFDKIKEDFSDRFINTGAAEQAMIDVAIGLALSGKIPFVYTITPFLLNRPYESIYLYLEKEYIPVMLVGSGVGKDYEHDGISHFEPPFNFTFKKYHPKYAFSIENDIYRMIESKEPSCLLLRR